MLSSSHPKICEPLVTGVSPRPTAPRPRQETAKHEGPVGAGYPVTSRDLLIFVEEAAEPVSSGHVNGRWPEVASLPDSGYRTQ